eukprot:22120-Chlamydomonas_euryale.AAC.1
MPTHPHLPTHTCPPQVIPYLTVYAVLPSSLVFLVVYSLATQRLPRKALFTGIVSTFAAFFAAFAFVLYPNHEAIHLHGVADTLAAVRELGVGLPGECKCVVACSALFCGAVLRC